MILFQIDFDMALFHFTQLVTKQPTNWEALIRLIEILRRTGNIADCSNYLTAVEKHYDNPNTETKFLYCLSLYQWYSGNLNGALKNFNRARQDKMLRQKALYNMIEICLSPADEILMEHLTENDDTEYKDSRTMALKTGVKIVV